MKKNYPIIILIITLFSACGGVDFRNYFQEVGYLSTTIANVNDRSVSLSNGMTIRTNRIIIAVNSTPILLVIENYTGSGYFYLRNSKINFSSSDTDIDMLGLHRGRIQYIKNINKDDRTIILEDDSEWFIPMDEHWASIDNWLLNPEIIIPDNKPPKGEFFINTATSKSIMGINVNTTNIND